MEKINQFDFYQIWKDLSSLRKAGDVRPHEVMFELINAIADVRMLLSGKPIPLGVSRKAAQSRYWVLFLNSNKVFQPN